MVNPNYQEATDFTTANVTFQRKLDGYLPPVPNELLDGYLIRLHTFLKELEQISMKLHILSPKGPWYSHTKPGACFMCVYISQSWVMHDIMSQYPHPENYIFLLDKNSQLRLVPKKIAKKLL